MISWIAIGKALSRTGSLCMRSGMEKEGGCQSWERRHIFLLALLGAFGPVNKNQR